MEKAPSSIIIANRRGEMTWMPQKARACNCEQGRTTSDARIEPGSPAAELKLLVEEQVSRGQPVLHRKCREGFLLDMKLHHAPEVDGADDINVMHEERLLRSTGILEKKPCGLLQAAAGIEQSFFARDLDAQAEVIVGIEVVGNHAGEVMHVDDQPREPRRRAGERSRSPAWFGRRSLPAPWDGDR